MAMQDRPARQSEWSPQNTAVHRVVLRRQRRCVFRLERRLQHRDEHLGPVGYKWDGASDLVFMDSSGVWKVVYAYRARVPAIFPGQSRSNIKHVRLFRLHRRPAIRLGRRRSPDVLAALTPVGAVPGSNCFCCVPLRPTVRGTPGSLGPLTGATDTHVLTSQPATRVVDVKRRWPSGSRLRRQLGGWSVAASRPVT